MFKASIALVLIAFAALAYGWVADNDAILYGSIGASILAGLLLLRATLADRKAYAEPERPDRERREPKPSRKSEADYSPAGSRSRRTGKGRVDSELTREVDVSADADDFLGADSEQATPFRPQSRRRERLPSAPEGAAWAGGGEDDEDDDYDEAGDAVEDHRAGRSSYAGGFDQDQEHPATAGTSPADDFRSRLAAVLGSTGEESPPQPAPAQKVNRAAPKPVPLDDDEDEDNEAPAAAAQRTRRSAPRPAPEAEPQPAAPKRRGRRKASESVIPVEPESEVDEPTDDPEWVHIDDVPQTSQVIQPGGGFARPDVPEEITHYRPRRPAVASTPPGPEAKAPAKAPASRKKRPPDAAAESKVRSVGPKPASRQSSGLTRVSPAEKTRSKAAKDRNPDAPPRRGRPPKPKP